MGRITFCFLCLNIAVLSQSCPAQKREGVTRTPAKAFSKNDRTSFIKNILQQYPEYFDSLLKKNNQWHISVIYTQIDRSADNKPSFKDYVFDTNEGAYFYPASTVKMPTAILALQRLKKLNLKGLDKNTTMITDSAYGGQSAVYNDPESEDGRPTIANYIKKIFLVSDNNSFNRLYEFLGQEYINKQLHKLGYRGAEIIHRLNISLPEDQNRYANPVTFYDSAGKQIYRKPLTESKLVYPERKELLGKAYYKGDKLITEPFDFSKKNRIRLQDLHDILKSILFPTSMPAAKRFNIWKEDYAFVYRYMSMKPVESSFPQYDSTYTDAYSKFLLYGGKGRLDSGIRIFNKEGDAYGFLTDIAYIVDFKKGVEFMLSATIYCNSDEIFNDDHYDYENVGYPFMKNLGKVFYEYECRRKRKNTPELSIFKFNYDTRTR